MTLISTSLVAIRSSSSRYVAPRSSSAGRRRARPVRHRAAHGQQRGDDDVGDRAEADDADAPPADLERPAGDHVDLRPPSGAHLVLHPAQVAGRAEQRAEHPLADGHGVEPGGVGQRDAGGVERGEVVARHADARLLDERQVRRARRCPRRSARRRRPPVVDHQLGVGERGGRSPPGRRGPGRRAVSGSPARRAAGHRRAARAGRRRRHHGSTGRPRTRRRWLPSASAWSTRLVAPADRQAPVGPSPRHGRIRCSSPNSCHR